MSSLNGKGKFTTHFPDDGAYRRGMSLIIKPSLLCNFKCTFCSSTTITEDSAALLDIGTIERFLDRYPETSTIIVNGGDPLMVDPSYYWDIIKLLDDRDMDHCTISFTSNLWPFHKKPEKWKELFNHPKLGITTSFHYGDTRLKGDHSVFTVEDFWAVSDSMLEHVGYRPDFIAVVDNSNVHTVMDTVLLAKEMGVEAKINHLLASGGTVDTGKVLMGSHDKMFTKGDICKEYVKIWKAGLMEYEHNTKELARAISTGDTICPLARDCDAGIRTLQPEGDYYSCGAFGDDKQYPIDFEYEMNGGFVRPLQVEELDTMKHSCYECPMFKICNGCKKTISDTKRLGLVEHHCRTMKSIAPDIIEMNGLTGIVEPTPYVDESLPLIFKG